MSKNTILKQFGDSFGKKDYELATVIAAKFDNIYRVVTSRGIVYRIKDSENSYKMNDSVLLAIIDKDTSSVFIVKKLDSNKSLTTVSSSYIIGNDLR